MVFPKQRCRDSDGVLGLTTDHDPQRGMEAEALGVIDE
jgi:hypothetical protein